MVYDCDVAGDTGQRGFLLKLQSWCGQVGDDFSAFRSAKVQKYQNVDVSKNRCSLSGKVEAISKVFHQASDISYDGVVLHVVKFIICKALGQ